MIVQAQEIKIGDKVSYSTGCGRVTRTVAEIVVNPSYGWLGFTFEELKNKPFNWLGWLNPTDDIERYIFHGQD